MATAIKPPYSLSITATGDYILPEAYAGRVSRWLIEIVFVDTITFGSCTLQARRAGGGGSWKVVPYTPLHFEGAALPDAFSTLPIANNALLEVDSSGMEINLSTVFIAGTSITVQATPMVG
jgi:hypothetical protein